MAFVYSPNSALRSSLGIRPLGNLYMCEDVPAALSHRASSLGMFGRISEETFVHVLSFLPAADLGKLCAVSKYVCAFANFDELWRDLFWVCESERVFESAGWKSSLQACTVVPNEVKKCRRDDATSKHVYPPVCAGVYSDWLYEPFRTSGMIPSQSWLERENIDRMKFDALTVSEFVAKYELTNKPVIITGYIDKFWPEFPKTMDQFHPHADAHADASTDTHTGTHTNTHTDTHKGEYSCGPVSMTLHAYKQYLDSQIWKLDASPYFVFDTAQFSNATHKYSVPPYFVNDMFDALPKGFRPENKWLLIGPPNASSKWHVDPNATNAWNGVVAGAKRWLLLPPHLGPPPGVSTSSDSFAVKQPLDLIDWFESFYAQTVEMYAGKGLVECTCRAGEIVFVPRGWWHCVRNVGSTTIAVTQNYAAPSSVVHVQTFLKKFSHCVSGISPELRSELWTEFDRVHTLTRCTEEQADATHNEEEETRNVSFWGNLGSRSIGFARNGPTHTANA